MHSSIEYQTEEKFYVKFILRDKTVEYNDDQMPEYNELELPKSVLRNASKVEELLNMAIEEADYKHKIDNADLKKVTFSREKGDIHHSKIVDLYDCIEYGEYVFEYVTTQRHLMNSSQAGEYHSTTNIEDNITLNEKLEKCLQICTENGLKQAKLYAQQEEFTLQHAKLLDRLFNRDKENALLFEKLLDRIETIQCHKCSIKEMVEKDPGFVKILFDYMRSFVYRSDLSTKITNKKGNGENDLDTFEVVGKCNEENEEKTTHFDEKGTEEQDLHKTNDAIGEEGIDASVLDKAEQASLPEHDDQPKFKTQGNYDDSQQNRDLKLEEEYSSITDENFKNSHQDSRSELEFLAYREMENMEKIFENTENSYCLGTEESSRTLNRSTPLREDPKERKRQSSLKNTSYSSRYVTDCENDISNEELDQTHNNHTQIIDNPYSKAQNEYTILMYGNIGIGKTTFINAFYHNIECKTFKSAHECSPKSLISGLYSLRDQVFNVGVQGYPFLKKDKRYSSTEKVQDYKIKNKKKTYRFIDTCGVNVAKSMEENWKNLEENLKVYTKIDFICCCLDADTNRRTDAFEFSLNLLCQLKDKISAKIIFCFMRSKTVGTGTYPIVEQYFAKHDPSIQLTNNIFYIDNEPYLYFLAKNKGLNLKTINHSDIEYIWKHSNDQLRKMIAYIEL